MQWALNQVDGCWRHWRDENLFHFGPHSISDDLRPRVLCDFSNAKQLEAVFPVDFESDGDECDYVGGNDEH